MSKGVVPHRVENDWLDTRYQPQQQPGEMPGLGGTQYGRVPVLAHVNPVRVKEMHRNVLLYREDGVLQG